MSERLSFTQEDLFDLAKRIDEDFGYTPDEHDRLVVRWVSPAVWSPLNETLAYETLTSWMDTNEIETFFSAAERLGFEGKTFREAADSLGCDAGSYSVLRDAVSEGRERLRLAVIRARAQGLAYTDIAEQYGLTYNRVYRWCKDAGEAPAPPASRPDVGGAAMAAIVGAILSGPDFEAAVRRVAREEIERAGLGD